MATKVKYNDEGLAYFTCMICSKSQFVQEHERAEFAVCNPCIKTLKKLVAAGK